MKITPCTTCKETGQTEGEKCQVVCSDCLGVGAVSVRLPVRGLDLTDALVDSLADDPGKHPQG